MLIASCSCIKSKTSSPVDIESLRKFKDLSQHYPSLRELIVSDLTDYILKCHKLAGRSSLSELLRGLASKNEYHHKNQDLALLINGVRQFVAKPDNVVGLGINLSADEFKTWCRSISSSAQDIILLFELIHPDVCDRASAEEKLHDNPGKFLIWYDMRSGHYVLSSQQAEHCHHLAFNFHSHGVGFTTREKVEFRSLLRLISSMGLRSLNGLPGTLVQDQDIEAEHFIFNRPQFLSQSATSTATC